MGQLSVPAGRRQDMFQSTGAEKEWIGMIKGSASYATGGDGFNVVSICGIREAKFVHIDNISQTYRLEVVYPNDGPVKTFKVRFRDIETLAEVANATDLSAETFRVRVIGK